MQYIARLTGLLFAVIAAAGTAQQSLDPYVLASPIKPLFKDANPSRTCQSLLSLSLENTSVTEAVVIQAAEDAPAWCKVTAIVRRSATDDPITVWVGLPLTSWNGRFMGVGGGGYVGGSPGSLPMHIASGFAAGATDAGPRTVQLDRNVKNGEFALDEEGRLDWTAIRNFGHRGVHVMTETARAITRAFYGKSPQYAYFSGCSTGGRQAMMEAQRYPDDYDGILAAAPGINAATYVPARLWGQLSMLLTNNFMPKCKFDAATQAAIAACDNLDGVEDNIIGNPRRCNYDPEGLVDTVIGECGVFTQDDAEVVRKSWEGPRSKDGSFMWYGFAPGAPLEILNGTEADDEAGLQPSSQWTKYFLSWHRYFLAQDPDLQFSTFTREKFENFWHQSIEQYRDVYSADNPNLSEFQARGGKIIMWHGETDTFIPPEGSIDYFKRVQQHFGNPRAANSVLRLFMAPGVNHCGGGTGPTPTAMLDALVTWVEKGKAPERLLAVTRDKETNEVIRSRPLCMYPRVARYKGEGSTDQAENFKCVADESD